MGWSPGSATKAYLDTLKLVKDDHDRRNGTSKLIVPESSEYISALAAGMSAKLIVEVSSEASSSTIALAAAARQTGGKLVCILPEEEVLAESKEVIKESGLKGIVEFKVGDPYELLPKYEKIDFSLVDCKTDSNRGLFKLLDVNPRRSVVVANNLSEGSKGLVSGVTGLRSKNMVRSVKQPIGKGMEVTMISESKDYWATRQSMKQDFQVRRSKWVMKIDEKSGEEHIYRVPKSL